MTPYVHLLCSHIVEIIKRYGSLSLFNQENFEAIHQAHKIIFFQGTTRGLNRYIPEEIMLKMVRLHLLPKFSKIEEILKYLEELKVNAQIIRKKLGITLFTSIPSRPKRNIKRNPPLIPPPSPVTPSLNF